MIFLITVIFNNNCVKNILFLTSKLLLNCVGITKYLYNTDLKWRHDWISGAPTSPSKFQGVERETVYKKCGQLSGYPVWI